MNLKRHSMRESRTLRYHQNMRVRPCWFSSSRNFLQGWTLEPKILRPQLLRLVSCTQWTNTPFQYSEIFMQIFLTFSLTFDSKTGRLDLKIGFDDDWSYRNQSKTFENSFYRMFIHSKYVPFMFQTRTTNIRQLQLIC